MKDCNIWHCKQKYLIRSGWSFSMPSSRIVTDTPKPEKGKLNPKIGGSIYLFCPISHPTAKLLGLRYSPVTPRFQAPSTIMLRSSRLIRRGLLLGQMHICMCIMTIRRNMMMRQTIMIKSRTCSSTTCPPTLGRSPQTMAERKIPVQEGGCASFFLFSKIFQQRCRKPLFKISYICGVVAAATSFKPRLDLENFWKAISLLHLDKFCWIWKFHLSHIFCSKSSPWFTLLLLKFFLLD